MKKAFTLAEVLITLGIIGVVAALTMPSLIANYKKQVYVTQLKKSMSVISQGLQKLMADDGVTSLSNLSKPVFGYRSCQNENNILNAFQLIERKNDYGTYCIEYDDNGLYNGGFDGIVELGYEWGLESDAYQLPDGTLFGIYQDNYSCEDNINIWGSMWLDINGDVKGPNIRGRDIFYFYVLDNGSIVPLYNKPLKCSGQYGDVPPIFDVAKNWKDMGSWGCTGNDKNANYGCAARIMEKGWKMDY